MHLLVLLLCRFDLLLGWLHDAWLLLRLLVLGVASAREGHVLLVVQLLVQFEIVVVEDELNDALEGVLASI